MEKTYALKDLEPVLHLKPPQIAVLIRRGDLEGINVGTGEKRARFIVTESALQDFLERRTHKPKQPVASNPYVRRWN